MRTYEVVLSPEAQADLEEIYDWIAERASPAVALGYVERLGDHLRGYAHAPKRGHRRDDLRLGLRIAGSSTPMSRSRASYRRESLRR